MIGINNFLVEVIIARKREKKEKLNKTLMKINTITSKDPICKP